MELTKKGTPRKRKPKQKIYYFTKDTEEAILEYIKTEQQPIRNKIYREKIEYAFFKLTQNIINTFKFPYMDGTIEDIQQECIEHLLQKLHLYNQSKGAAYSYFGTCVKRYLINNNNKSYKKIKKTDNLEDVDDIDNEHESDENYKLESLYVFNKFIEYMDHHMVYIFSDEEELRICEAILLLFKKVENIEILEKKAILLYLREITKKETINITKILIKLKKIYNRLNQQYLEYGYISLNF